MNWLELWQDNLNQNYEWETGIENVFTPDSHSVTICDNFIQYKETYRYIYRNPVVAGLATHPENYPYSTLPKLLGKSSLDFLLLDDLGIILNPSDGLIWLNQPTQSNHN